MLAAMLLNTRRIFRSRDVFQNLPGHHRQLGEVHRQQKGLIARQQLSYRPTAGLILEIEIGQFLPGLVRDDEASFAFVD